MHVPQLTPTLNIKTDADDRQKIFTAVLFIALCLCWCYFGSNKSKWSTLGYSVAGYSATKSKFYENSMTMPRKIASLMMIIITFLGCQSGAHQDENENTCTLYIAQSSMEGVTGVGIFTAKPFKTGSVVSRPDSPSIPVCDPWPNSGLVNHYWWGEGKGTSDEMSFECVHYAVSFDYLNTPFQCLYIR